MSLREKSRLDLDEKKEKRVEVISFDRVENGTKK